MKKFTYPVAKNAQAEAYRKIFDEEYTVDNTGNVKTSNPGRIKGINNSPNLIKLFKNSPFYEATSDTLDDRGNLLRQGVAPLTDDLISQMFQTVIDGRVSGVPHVLKKGEDSEMSYTDSKNYNWLYRDQPMDMNFKYLKPDGDSSNTFIPSSPNSTTAPVGSNAPIDNSALTDKPFWGHANLQVPSIDPLDTRDDHDGKPQLLRGSGGFGTNYPISNRPFAAQEKIGTYFTNTYVNAGSESDRMNTAIAGRSIDGGDENKVTTGNSVYLGDINTDGTPRTIATK
jgi:hypothetical protein